MYHITITENGKLVHELDAVGVSMFATVEHDGSRGTECVTLFDGMRTKDVFSMILSFDHIRDRLFHQNPMLKLMYAMKDEIVKDALEIDLTGVEKLRRSRESD